MTKHIAIIEDDALLRQNYVDALTRHGYLVSDYANRQQALAAFQQQYPHLVIIDINLGDETEGGFELCRELRNQSATLPIIFLTAKNNDIDAISGLRLGADDYLTKDISINHLLARINALFRRNQVLSQQSEQPSKQLTVNDLTINPDKMEITWRNELITLTVTEFWIIHALAKYPGHVKTRDQLMQDANLVVDDGTITSYIKRIRKKFQVIDPNFDAIDAIYGVGYRWKQ